MTAHDTVGAMVEVEKMKSLLREAEGALSRAEVTCAEVRSRLESLPRSEAELLKLWAYFLAVSHVYYSYAGVRVPEEHRVMPLVIGDDVSALREACRSAGQTALNAVQTYIDELKKLTGFMDKCAAAASPLLAMMTGEVDGCDE